MYKRSIDVVTHLIQRSEPSPVPPDTLPLSESELEGLSQCESTVLRRVVVVDLEISFAVKSERHLSVLGHSVEHLKLEEERRREGEEGRRREGESEIGELGFKKAGWSGRARFLSQHERKSFKGTFAFY